MRRQKAASFVWSRPCGSSNCALFHRFWWKQPSCTQSHNFEGRPLMMADANFSPDSMAHEARAAIGSLSAAEAEALRFDWSWWARGNQRAPESAWANWLILAGRGFGKTRIGAEMVRHWV